MSPAPTLCLYYAPGACSLASHILLEQSGLAYRRRRVALDNGEHLTPDYLAINPDGRVPVLETGSGHLTESLAIMGYIDRLAPECEFLPRSDALIEGHCLSLAAWLATTVHPTFRLMTRTERLTEDPACQRQLHASGHRTAWEQLQRLDRRLRSQEGPWMLGPRYTICDPYALVFYGSGLVAGYPMDVLTAFTAWKDRMLALPAVVRILGMEENPLLRGTT